MHVIGGRFEIEKLVGAGGMGMVYRAHDRERGSTVAVKLVHVQDDTTLSRFAREGRVLAELSHPALVRYIDQGRAPSGEAYLALEWLEGETLADRLKRAGLTVGETLAMARRVADALAVAHARGIVHRDIKPANLFLPGGAPEQVKVLDFGIALLSDDRSLTMTGMVVGTPAYMSPEQVKGQREIDARVDVYALGVVLFECLAGRRPHVGAAQNEVVARMLTAEPPRLASLVPDVPPALDALVARMLARDPAARPANAAEVALALDSLAEVTGSRAAPAVVAPAALATDERRLLTVVLIGRPVIDLDEDTTRTLALQQGRTEALRPAVSPFGGDLTVLLDGSILVVFTGLETATDQARQAARCALAARAVDPATPAAVATGHGVARARSMSDAVDRAVRLLPPSPGVAVDDTTAALLGEGFELTAGDGGQLLLGQRYAAAPGRTLLGKPTRFVGRSVELTTLRGVLQGCVDEPSARAVLVKAEPGMGKSRLRYEFVREVRERAGDVEVWLGAADPMRQGPGALLAAALHDALGVAEGEPAEARRARLRARLEARLPAGDVRHVGDFLGELIDARVGDESAELAAARRDAKVMGDQIQRAWEELLAAELARAPLLLVLEDLHWGDALSVRLVDTALRNLADRPLMVLALTRPGIDARFPRLWAGRSVQEIVLAELGRRASEQLVRQALGASVDAGTVATVVERAGGNTFFLEELVRAVSEGKGDGLPGSVLAITQGRLERMPAEARRVLRAGSVFGQVFWESGVSALLGGGEATRDVREWLEDLVAREVLLRRGEGRLAGQVEYSFRHALLRDAAYAMLTEDDRVLGHRLAAEWLERVGEPSAVMVAEHFEKGRARERAAGWYLRAASDALTKSDFRQVVDFGGLALACGAVDDAATELHWILGKAQGFLGRWTDARAELEAALVGLGERDPGRRAGLLVDAANACFWGTDIERADAYFAQAGAVARAAGDADAEVDAALGRASCESARGDVVRALEMANASMPVVLRRGHSTVRMMFPSLFHYWLGNLGAGIEVGLGAAANARPINDITGLVSNLSQVGMALASLGRYREAQEAFAEAAQVGKKYNLATHTARSMAMSVGYHLEVFDYDGAEALANQAVEIANSQQFIGPVISASIDLVSIAVRRGDPEKAETLAGPVAPAIEKAGGFHGWLWKIRLLVARSEIALARNRPDEAAEIAGTAMDQARAYRRVKYLGLAALVRGRALRALGRPAEALADLALAAETFDAMGAVALWLVAASALLETENSPALAAAERSALAARAHTSALRVADALPATLSAGFLAAAPIAQRVRLDA